MFRNSCMVTTCIWENCRIYECYPDEEMYPLLPVVCQDMGHLCCGWGPNKADIMGLTDSAVFTPLLFCNPRTRLGGLVVDQNVEYASCRNLESQYNS